MHEMMGIDIATSHFSLFRMTIGKVCTEEFLQLISLQPSSKEPSSIQFSQTSKV